MDSAFADEKDGLNKPDSFVLLLAAKQLRNERLVKIFESFLEYRACVSRVVIQAIIAIWSGAWLYGPQPVLVEDAVRVVSSSIILLFVAIIWMLLVRRKIIPSFEWLDAAGFALNFIFIAIQTYLAFLLLIALNAFLPFIAIAAAARYGRKAIKPVILMAFLLLLIAAPRGYWISRPAYFVYAFALTVLLPLLFSRIVIAMQEIACQALDSRNAQSRFISAMSHELRTPLNAIINCAILIDTEAMQSEQKDMMKAVSVNAMALRHRVNEVLDVASIDGEKLTLQKKAMSLADVLTTVQAVCGNAASAKGITLGFNLESLESPHLEGDEGRIEQVITNLVTNAIKFTPSGGTVDLYVFAEPEDGCLNVTVTVTDSGIGVPDNKKEAIFAPFTQLSSGLARAEGGVGLGLYIARSVSNAMKGKLSVYDNPSGGSIFEWTFSAPRASSNGMQLNDLQKSIELHKKSVPSMRCLVFEDMEVNRMVVGNLLRRAGHEVLFHADGYHVVERIRTARADVVFLDLHMPGKSGWNVLRDVADSITALPPIVMLTADTRSQSVRDAIAIGVAGYLAKPINAFELLGVVKECHEQGRRCG